MHIRIALPRDAVAVTELLLRTYPALMASSYDAELLAGALPVMTRANPELLASGKYYVVEDAGRLVGCGGWSLDQPGSGKIEAGLSHLRHFATDPDMTRRGIGRSIILRCAVDAAKYGTKRFQAFAGLNAEPFYRSLGLERLAVFELAMGPTAKLPAVLMEGPLPSEAH